MKNIKKTFKIVSGLIQRAWKYNENDQKHTILRQEQIGKYLVVEADFPLCPTPVKIMVFDYQPDMDNLDPHFHYDESPIARFNPHNYGYQNAIKFAETMCKEDEDRVLRAILDGGIAKHRDELDWKENQCNT